MDDRKDEAAEYRERAQQLLWIADLVTRDDARKILFQVAAEYRDRARQLEEIINAEEARKTRNGQSAQVMRSKWAGQPKRQPDERG